MNSNQSSQKPEPSPSVNQSIESSEEKETTNENSNPQSTRKVQFYSYARLMSPLEKDIVELKDFSTPIQIAEFSQNKKYPNDQPNDESSPLIKIQLSGIRNIVERQNEDSQNSSMKSFEQSHEIQVDTVLDLMGNKIYEFSLNGHNNKSEDDENEFSPIVQDKENDIPENYMNLNTPLKIKHNDIRSPLQDITPSMTHKKKDDPSFNTKTNKKNKTSNKTANKVLGCEIEKWGLLTPRTMAESRLNKGKNPRLNQSKLKIQRFL